MAKPPPSLYSVEKTFVWFAVAGLTLTLSLLLIVGQDHAREWKKWQRKFLRLKYEKTQTELKEAEQKLDRQKLDALQKELYRAHKDFKAQKSKYRPLSGAVPILEKKHDEWDRPLKKEIAKLETEIAKARAQYQDLKQYQDSYKYFLEEYQTHHDPRAKEYKTKLSELKPRLEASRLEVERLEKEQEEKEAAVEGLKVEEKRLEKEKEELTLETDRIKRRLSKIKPSLVKELLNAPMLDFLQPSLQIQQVVLEDLYDDFHFARVQKVDRCTTCHLGIDQKGFEDAPRPFRTHPKLEVFVGSDSPHPLEKFGCTVCHGGNGHSLTFKDSAHTPQDKEQKKKWEKEYHWQPLEKWTAKMLPLNHTEASCAKCHRGVVDIPQAEKLDEGRHLVRTFGCYGCHKIEGFSPAGENLWKVGPSLQQVGSKAEKDWIIRWLQNPKAFRPTTHMPRIFHLSNTRTPEDVEKNQAVIEGIAAYLIKNSTPVELTKPREKGDPKIGEELVKNLGCLGCHSVDSLGVNDHGPNLSGMGSKTTPEWLFTWLKDPKHFRPDTRMPSLRLTDEEASHVTSYLMTLRNEPFENQPVPEVKPERVDELVLGFLRTKMRHDEAAAALAKMEAQGKLVFLGEKMIAHQGCFACHDIHGFENAKPIGTELTQEGSKEVERLDFGFIPLERTRQAWFFQKLKDPRIFDQGKIRDYLEKLKMPQFDFTDAQAEALTTFLLSQVEDPIPLEMERQLDLKEEEIEAGRLLVSKLNCQGCHLLEGKGGRVKELLEDPGLAPPPLNGEGAKVEEDWLYKFLKGPTPIRPWLKYRMPTFGFSHEELTALVKYFSHSAHQDIFFGKAKAEDAPLPSPGSLAAGKKLFEMFQCAKCHEPKTGAALGASFLAPDLTLAKTRLKSPWIAEWLKDPQSLQPGTMMPTFFPEGQSPAPDVLGGDAEKQIEAIRDYLLEYHKPEPSSS